MNNIPYFKVGDTFHVPIKFFDTETDYPVEITPDMTVSCNIKLSSSRVIYSPVVTVLDQNINENKGYVILSVDDTTGWTVGQAVLDIKLIWGGSIRHSQDFKFNVVRSITQ